MISSFCSADKPQCVNVDFGANGVLISNTDVQHKQIFATYDEWEAFIKGVKAGEFDATVGIPV